MSDIQKRVYALIAEQAARSAADVHDDQRLEDIGLDSLDVVELSLAVEDEFKFTMTGEEFDAFYEFQTVGNVVDFVQGKAVTA